MTLAEALQLLELSTPFTKAELKTAYRQALMVWHPDRFTGNKEMLDKAHARTYRINEAFDYLSRAMGKDNAFNPTDRNQSKPESAKPPQRHATGSQQSPKPESQTSSQGKPAGSATNRNTSQSSTANKQKEQPGEGFTPRHQVRGKNGLSNLKWNRIAGATVLLLGVGLLVGSLVAKYNTPSAQFERAERYANGVGVPKDVVEAAKLYRKAAEQGLAKAQYELAECYNLGVGVEKNGKEAMRWYRKAAEQGFANAEFWLWHNVLLGAESFILLSKAAEHGHIVAQFELGDSYARGGFRREKNFAEAAKWYRKAAEQGHMGAQTKLGYCYYKGEGVERNLVEAVNWYRKAADQGNADAQCSLGLHYRYKSNESEAVKWYRKAAEQGNAEAQWSLGSLYESGKGVKKNLSEAVKWYRKAAEQGNAIGQCCLGDAYKEGVALEKNLAEAVKWYRKAAEQGNEFAQFQIEELEFTGINKPSLPRISSAQADEAALLRHLPTDERLATGSVLVDHLRQHSGKGKLTLDNGLAEDAFVKLVLNGKLVASFYVRSQEKFTYSTIPDGGYTVLYCTGFGWDARVRDFARGRHAQRYDAPINYSTLQTGNTISTDVVSLTLHKVIDGNARTTNISLDEFDRY